MCYIGELENTMLQMYLKGSRLHAWLSSPKCPQAIQECKILLDCTYEVHDSDVHGTELHTSAKSLDLPADLKVLIGRGAAVLHLWVKHMGVVYSQVTTHLGNSLVLFYPQGNHSSLPVPGSIKHIYKLNRTTTLAIQWQHTLGGNNTDLDPFTAYPHFPASTYSSALSETLKVVEMTWVHAHYVLNSVPSNELGWNALALTKWLGLGLPLRAMVVVVEQDALGLWQLSPKLISTCVITKYGKLHYSMLIRVVESCTMALIQHYAHWAVSNDHVVVLSLSQIYLPSQVSCIVLTNLSCRINTCVLSCSLPCTTWQL